jgi:hypothetical protein
MNVLNKKNRLKNNSFGSLQKKDIYHAFNIVVYLKNFLLHRFVICFYCLNYFIFNRDDLFLLDTNTRHLYLKLDGSFFSQFGNLRKSFYFNSSTSGRAFQFQAGILPLKKRRFTILRSPHVDKKSREQFELITYSRSIFIQILGRVNLIKIRSLLRAMGNSIGGVGYRVTERSYKIY